ncbi:MAG: T9SS type A sorting domain-containing protein [Bacteroidetes bacterium]|nr:T9SS type A sorting domain-containing protein [Bacteroidota bacterium]
MKSRLFFLLIFGYSILGYSQSGPLSIFNPSQVPVLNLNGDTLEYPFAGGLNNCQFGSIDLNMDNIKDLIVFDRHGNRVLPFINNNIPGTISYSYRPEFASELPAISQWIELLDYNGDGKEDIFTYTTGGIKVFRNESSTSLKFRQVSFPYLLSMQGSTLTNILVTYADYPAIVDVDGDGDMDILTFWGLGSFVEWHKNMSEEYYGNADSLVFVKSSTCWGRFAEGIESNEIKLDTCIDFGQKTLKDSDPKHTGSTLFANDFNQDGIIDMAIGDVDFPEVIELTNSGSQDTAIMTAQTTNFPGTEHPVYLTSFPAICSADVDNDGIKDLLVSSFDPSLVRSQSDHSSWLYLASADKTMNGLSFQFLQDDFLQDQMIDMGSGAYPLFFDFDADGLQDLVIGNYGQLDSSWIDPTYGLQCSYISTLALFRNVGTAEKPAFQLITRDYLGLSSLGMQSLVPCAGDLDGDGDTDLLIGNSKGKLVYFENTANAGAPANFVMKDPAFKQIDVGDFAAPQLIDLDKDGLTDIVCGRRDGQLSYYRNTGPQSNPEFEIVTDSLGGVDVTNTALSYFGYSVPYFYRGKDQRTALLVGSEFGEIFLYAAIDGNLDGKFLAEGTIAGINPGWRSSVALADLDSDHFPDMMVGNYSGGLNYYRGTEETPFGIADEGLSAPPGMELSPNPSTKKVLINLSAYEIGRADLRAMQVDGKQVAQLKDIQFPYVLDISKYKTGFYLVQVLTGKGIITGKMIKVN